MPKPSQSSLTQATSALAEWRKRATAGVAAVSGMKHAVEKMDASMQVNAILNGKRGK